MPIVDSSSPRFPGLQRLVETENRVVDDKNNSRQAQPHWAMAPLDAKGSIPSLQASKSTTIPGLVRATTHEIKIENAAKLVTKESMLKTLVTLCKDPVLRPREAADPDYIKAAQWCADQLASFGVEPLGDVGADGKKTFLQHFEWKERYENRVSKSANVVGVLRGNGPEPRKAVLLSAHLDNLSHGEKEDYRRRDGRDLSQYEGANDNTASVAIVLDTMKALAATGPYRDDVIVLIPSAEEDYLMGASAFAQSPPVPLDSIIANVNLEMPGHGSTEDIYVYGGTSTHQQDRNPLFDRAMRVTKDQPVPLKDGMTIDNGEGWFQRQDGLVMSNVGIPNILLQGGAAEDNYHTASDVVEDLNMEKVEVLGRHTARIVADLADDKEPFESRGPVRGSANPSGRYVKATGG
jgi:hypothetical protein